MANALVDAIADMRDEDAVRMAQEMIDGGTSPLEILDDWWIDATREYGTC
jgi:methanogenic corrinoid protein MtbC1